jgi:hypothetical protein
MIRYSAFVHPFLRYVSTLSYRISYKFIHIILVSFWTPRHNTFEVAYAWWDWTEEEGQAEEGGGKKVRHRTEQGQIRPKGDEQGDTAQ